MSGAHLLLDVSPGTIGNVVEFSCPRCHRSGRHSVDERGTRLLTAAGITVAYPDPKSDQREHNIVSW